jgi:flagellin
MSFRINTNIAALEAQEYLRINSDYQSKTINRVTSGLRIVSSGDDAAGLAIANSLRSDQTVLAQGVRNANDGLSTLQTIDGGINNISKLLDRARTLATQSASGTFTGDRTVLNSEFQSVLSEIDRQAKAIGLNSGGDFARTLSVFIGGGRGTSTSEITTNGSVSVDLSASSVDSQSLGLKGHQVASAMDLSVNSISAISAGNGNATSATFTFSGPGFVASNNTTLSADVAVTVNLNGVNSTESLVTAINAAIEGAGLAGTPQALAFKAANIRAAVSSDGKSFTLTSANQAFKVKGDAMGNALLGQVTGGVAGKAAGDAYMLSGGIRASAEMAFAAVSGGTQYLTFIANDANGAQKQVQVAINSTSGASLTEAVESINKALQDSGDATLNKIVAVVADQSGATEKIRFASNLSSFRVVVSAEPTATEGFTDTDNTTVQSSDYGTVVSADIATKSAAENAVNALSDAVEALGRAQAVVGKGQNSFSYAINLASSQLTNIAAAESRIRDADLAQEAANLTKAQIILQAGIAAMAQANSAPQAVLALLRG